MCKELERSRVERDKWAKKVEEAERVLTEVTEQYEHQLQRYKNYQKYVAKGERARRTHRLCTIGGTIEGLAPEVKELSTVEMYELMKQIFTMPEVKAAVKRATGKGET